MAAKTSPRAATGNSRSAAAAAVHLVAHLRSSHIRRPPQPFIQRMHISRQRFQLRVQRIPRRRQPPLVLNRHSPCAQPHRQFFRPQRNHIGQRKLMLRSSSATAGSISVALNRGQHRSPSAPESAHTALPTARNKQSPPGRRYTPRSARSRPERLDAAGAFGLSRSGSFSRTSSSAVSE